MDASKDALIQRLLKEGKINQDEFYLLSRKEIEYVEATPPAFPRITPFKDRNDFLDHFAQNEQKIKQNMLQMCSCNPANGGSGICGCTLTSPTITC